MNLVGLTRKKITLVFAGLTMLSFILFGLTSPSKPKDTAVENEQVKGEQTIASSSPTPDATNSDQVIVTIVIDGDTIEIESGQRVRLIGIDTPETVDPKRPIGCYGKEASNFTKAQLTGKKVRLEKDVSETDKYGRLLRYVWIDDTLFNERLVKEGYAQASTYPPDVKYQTNFLNAQKEARENNKGLWSSCPTKLSNQTTQVLPTEAVKSTVKPTSQTSCQFSCSGPDRDCSDFSTHAEAQAFFDCCGFSANNDPMRLDRATGQGNGLACESLR